MPNSTVEIRFKRDYRGYMEGQVIMPDLETANLFVNASRVAEYVIPDEVSLEQPSVRRQRRKRRKSSQP